MASPTFSASIASGRPLFEQGSFHAAHQAWESGWRQTHGSERRVLEVLVLWSSALQHHAHGKQLGANRLMDSSNWVTSAKGSMGWIWKVFARGW